jgi:predicted Zn-dependent protease
MARLLLGLAWPAYCGIVAALMLSGLSSLRFRLRLWVRVGWLSAGLAGLPIAAAAQEAAAVPWSERESRLANEYLSLLVSQPEYGRMVDLLWALYEKHRATALLLENVSAQAQATRHPAALLVQGHLLRKSGDLKGAAAVYDEVLKAEPTNSHALRSRADAARHLGDPAAAAVLVRRWTDLLPAGDKRKPGGLLETGTLELSAGRPEEAAQAWEQAARLQPQDFELARQVAELLLRAGFPARAAAFYAQLAEQTEPRQRLNAYFDLARIHEHADQFAAADEALRKGLALLDFRDGRYGEFFRRRVRLHERFGALEDLRQDLLRAAERQPPAEQALRDMTLFYAATVDPDEHLRWLRALAARAPATDEYRWELVRALLDHEGAAEAAALLDERMKGDGSDPAAVVFLRCEADLRRGETAAAAEQLKKLLAAQGDALEVEKQALNFAQTRALDPVIEMILRRRLDRDPSKGEAVFELAAFYRARKETAAADAVLNRFIGGATHEVERQRRLNDAAAFLAAGSDLDSAIMAARKAAALPGAGREELVRLADLLAEHGDTEEAISQLEKAWQTSATDEERIDVDERLFSLLMGGGEAERKDLGSITQEFRLPDAFTGRGFASDAPAGPGADIPESVVAQVRRFWGQVEDVRGTPPTPASGTEAQQAQTQAEAVARRLPANAPAEQVFRAAWWAVRAEMLEEAYEALTTLVFDPKTGQQRELSLEAQKLLLDLTLIDGNKALAMRTLRSLTQRDPANKVRYILRLSELMMETDQAVLTAALNNKWKPLVAMASAAAMQGATELLQNAYQEMPDSEALLSALTQIYSMQRRHEDALKLWKQAVERAPASASASLRERYGELLLRLQKLPEYVATQLELVERETEVKQRREIFSRLLDRLLWADQGGGGGELPPDLKKQRLDLLSNALTEKLRRHPFDGFYSEALALIHERNGDAAKAFEYMKQAYYTAPETPFSLGQLRDAALRVNDLKSAIYFQKQVAATAPPGELAGESRRLVELLEQTFQIGEADRVRRRLESRFSQDAAALEDLAKHYEATGQDEAERRVYEQVAKVRPWDAASQLRIALKCVRLADETAAERHLRDILEKTKAHAVKNRGAAGERLPLPLANQRKPAPAGPVSEITALLDNSSHLERDETNRLRSFLTLPRPEFTAIPETVPLVRLRAIEELSRLLRTAGGEALSAWTKQWQEDAEAAPMEKLWALYYAGAGEAFRDNLKTLLGGRTDLEAQFSLAWLMVRSNGMQDALQWAEQSTVNVAVLETRKRLLLAVVSMAADLESFRFEKGELAALGTARLLRDPPLRDIIDRLQNRQRYTEALEFGESLRRGPNSPSDDFFLGRIALSAERWDLARKYMTGVARAPTGPGRIGGIFDPYLTSLSTSSRLALSAQEREETLKLAWKRLQRTPDSPLTTLHRAVVIGLAGASNPAAEELEQLITGDFLVSRTISETRGMLLPQGSPRAEEPLHLQGLWEETREIQGSLVQQGLGPVVREMNGKLSQRWGNIALSTQVQQKFGEWRMTHLLRQLRQADYPQRLRLIREHLASVDMRTEMAVEVLGELGSRLETYGMAREAIEIYRLLPSRAPVNPDYALSLIRACETASEIKLGAQFTHQLILAEPPLKPPLPGDETLREQHARFLALDFDVVQLRSLGFLIPVTRVPQGRIPKEAPYLRELALLHERLGQDEQALAAWDRMHLAFTTNAESGIRPDAESCLHRGRLLRKQGKNASALAALREVPLTDQGGQFALEALQLRADLLAEAGQWEEFRELMATAVERKALEAIRHLTDLLGRHQREAEALNFLTQAERSVKDDASRFMLRLELLRLMAREPTWTPERGRSHVAALFRARSREREHLTRLIEWMRQQAKGPNQQAWRALLRAEARAGTDRPVAALALCAFAADLPAGGVEDLARGWQAAGEGDRLCLELAAETLLTVNRPTWAWRACEVLRDLPSLRLDGQKLPLMVRVAHAMGDRVAVRELFSEVIRMAFPGGARTVAWADAFAEAGEDGLARELFSTALERLHDTETVHPEIEAAWARFLIQRQDHEAAEAFLMRHHWAITGEAAARVLFELYHSWGRLASLKAELPKFHLPPGVEKEVLFLASQTLGLPPPFAQPAPPAPAAAP